MSSSDLTAVRRGLSGTRREVALAIEARTTASYTSELLVGVIIIPRPGPLVTLAMDGLPSTKGLNLGLNDSFPSSIDCFMNCVERVGAHSGVAYMWNVRWGQRRSEKDVRSLHPTRDDHSTNLRQMRKWR